MMSDIMGFLFIIMKDGIIAFKFFNRDRVNTLDDNDFMFRSDVSNLNGCI